MPKDNHKAVITCRTGLGIKKLIINQKTKRIHRIIVFFTHLTSIERKINSIKRIQNSTHDIIYSFSQKRFLIKRVYVNKDSIQKKPNLIFCLFIILFFSHERMFHLTLFSFFKVCFFLFSLIKK